MGATPPKKYFESEGAFTLESDRGPSASKYQHVTERFTMAGTVLRNARCANAL